jgi:dipeptidase D
VHGPLELLFTVDEERGLTGASSLDPSLLAGRRLLNLDSEEEGVLTVGCAGGADSRLTLHLRSRPVPGEAVALAVKLRGLRGGHSGVDIHLQRGNALKLLNRALFATSLEVPFQLAGLGGGDKPNAIPREALALVVLAEAQVSRFKQVLEVQLGAIRDEYRPAEPGLAWEIGAAAVSERVWDGPTTTKVLQFLAALPHGVLAMSYDIPGLVETSTNVARVAAEEGRLSVVLSSRSSVASALKATRQRIRAIAGLAAAQVAEGSGYPGWKPNLDSPLLATLKRTHQQVLGAAPTVGAIHAGLECGIIGEKVPGMDMISFGPTIQFPHSPDERVHIESVGRFYRLLAATLEALAA